MYAAISSAAIVFVLCINSSIDIVDTACWCQPKKLVSVIWEEDDGIKYFRGGFSIPIVEETDDWSVIIRFSTPVRIIEVS